MTFLLFFWVSAAAADINRFTIKLGRFDPTVIDEVTVYLWFGVDVAGAQNALQVRRLSALAQDSEGQTVTFLSRDQEIVVPEETKFVAVQAVGHFGGLPVSATPFAVSPVRDFMSNGQGLMTLYFQSSLSEALRETEIFQRDSDFATRFEDHSVLVSNTIFHFIRLGLVSEKSDYAIINDFLERTETDILRLSEQERDQLFGMMIGIFNERMRKAADPDIGAFLEFFVRFGNDMLDLGTGAENTSVRLVPERGLMQSMEIAYRLDTLPLLDQATISMQALLSARQYGDCVVMGLAVMRALDANVFAVHADLTDFGLTSAQLDQVTTLLRRGQSCVRRDVASVASSEIGDLVNNQEWGKLATYYSNEERYGSFNRYFMLTFDRLRDHLKPQLRPEAAEVLNYIKILAAGLTGTTN